MKVNKKKSYRCWIDSPDCRDQMLVLDPVRWKYEFLTEDTNISFIFDIRTKLVIDDSRLTAKQFLEANAAIRQVS